MRLEGKPHPGNIAVGIVQKPLMRHEWAAYRIAGNRLLSLELEVPLFAAEQNVGERSFVWHEIKSGTGEPAVVPGRGVRAEIPIRSPSYSFGCRCKPLPRRRPTCPIDPAHPHERCRSSRSDISTSARRMLRERHATDQQIGSAATNYRDRTIDREGICTPLRRTRHSYTRPTAVDWT